MLLIFGISNGAVQGLAEGYAVYSYLVAAQPLPFASLGFIMAAVGFATWISAIPLLFLLFPSGRLPSKRWWVLAVLIAAAYLVMVLFLWRSPEAAFTPLPNPFVVSGAAGRQVADITSLALSFILFVAIPASALSVIVRAIRARGQERQQFKWLGLASILMILTILLNSEIVPLLPGTLDALLEAAAYAGIPLTVGIAVLRYRLWDIDVIIRKTVLYAVVTLLLGVVYTVLWSSFRGFSRGSLVRIHRPHWFSRRWPSRVCSRRCAAGCNRSSTAASTGASTTPSRCSTGLR